MPSKRPPRGWLSMWLPVITGGACGVLSRPPHEEIADGVDADLEVARARPREQQLARGDVFLRERRAVDAVARDRADPRHLRVAAPQALLVDAGDGVREVFADHVPPVTLS